MEQPHAANARGRSSRIRHKTELHDGHGKGDQLPYSDTVPCCSNWQKVDVSFWSCPGQGPEAILQLQELSQNKQHTADAQSQPVNAPAPMYHPQLLHSPFPVILAPYPYPSSSVPQYHHWSPSNSFRPQSLNGSGASFDPNMQSSISHQSRESSRANLQHRIPSPKITNGACLRAFIKEAAKFPEYQYYSNEVLNTFSNSHHLSILHIQPEGNPDHLLRLHLLLHAIKSLNLYLANERKILAAGAIIVVDSIDGNYHGLKQANWVVHQQTTHSAVDVLNGLGRAYGRITVLSGTCNNSGYIQASSRIMSTIETMVMASSNKDFVWHECSRAYLLTNFLDQLADSMVLRDKCKGISVTSGLSVDEKKCNVKFGMGGNFSIPSFVQQSGRMEIPLVFVDKCTLELTNPYAKLKSLAELSAGEDWLPNANNLIHMSSLWNRILPPQVHISITKNCMDDLAVELYRLRARAARNAGQDNVDQLTRDISERTGRHWANRAVDASSYSRSNCEQKSVEQALMTIGRHVEAPMDFELDAIVGALLDRSRSTDKLMAVRIQLLDGNTPAFRLNSHCQMYMLVPKPGHRLDRVMYEMWVSFIEDIYYGMGLLAVDASLATAWEELVRVVEEHIKSLIQSQGRVWTKTHMQIAQRIVYHCQHGSMRLLCNLARNAT